MTASYLVCIFLLYNNRCEVTDSQFPSKMLMVYDHMSPKCFNKPNMAYKLQFCLIRQSLIVYHRL